ncbi:hypothetical protein EYF80_053299 [Liparis tanakae]|uniref:Uncharacterized protein n=1 Tax=Liparis tanakae TaxID=230148 RepID=A0A4Z2F5M0_9TELE|nr:hypothetical protein EYF80_053299 [Liparis tanakae]
MRHKETLRHPSTAWQARKTQPANQDRRPNRPIRTVRPNRPIRTFRPNHSMKFIGLSPEEPCGLRVLPKETTEVSRPGDTMHTLSPMSPPAQVGVKRKMQSGEKIIFAAPIMAMSRWKPMVTKDVGCHESLSNAESRREEAGGASGDSSLKETLDSGFWAAVRLLERAGVWCGGTAVEPNVTDLLFSDWLMGGFTVKPEPFPGVVAGALPISYR